MRKALTVSCPKCGCRIRKSIFSDNNYKVSERAKLARFENGKSRRLLSDRDKRIIESHPWERKLSINAKADYIYMNRDLLGIKGMSDNRPVTRRCVWDFLRTLAKK